MPLSIEPTESSSLHDLCESMRSRSREISTSVAARDALSNAQLTAAAAALEDAAVDLTEAALRLRFAIRLRHEPAVNNRRFAQSEAKTTANCAPRGTIEGGDHGQEG